MKTSTQRAAALFRFDTRFVKPKLYHLAVLGAVTAGLLAWILSEESPGRLLAANVLLAVFCAVTIVCLADAWIKQLEYNPYSYNTIIYSGFALFDLFLLATHTRAAIRCAAVPESFTREAVVLTLLNSAKNYMVLTAPFLCLFAAALFISNLSLIRHEGRRFVNILGIILSLLLVGGEVVIHLLNRITNVGLAAAAAASAVTAGAEDAVSQAAGSGALESAAALAARFRIMRFAVNLSASFYLYFECMIIGTIIAFAVTAFYRPAYDKDYLIILGCGLMPDGTPTPLLKGRVDLALDFYRRQLKETGREALFVVSGGQGRDEVQSEAASMRDYLLSRGIAADRIILEDKSDNTAENMLFSKACILKDARERGRLAGDRDKAAHDENEKAAGEDSPSTVLLKRLGLIPLHTTYPTKGPLSRVAFFTTNYHVFRAGLKGRRVRMRVQGMGAPTKWYFWPNAAVREFVGLLTEHRLKQGLLLGGIIVFYGVLTLLIR